MNGNQKIFHYYGDIVRRLLVAAAIIMLVGLPIFNDRLPAPLFISIIAVLILGLFAGITNPKSVLVSIVNTIFSLAGIIIFEYYAVEFPFPRDLLFWFNQILALIFFAAFYYSIKSWRARIVDN